MVFVTKVALDTNMLLSINELKVDIFRGIKEILGRVEFIVPKQVLEELNNLEKLNTKNKKNVSIARQLLQKNKVKQVLVMANNADNALINLSEKAFIASNDKKLKKAVIEKKGHIIFLRQKKLVEVY